MSLRPIVLAVVGHVDSGKTTFLDNFRRSSVSKHEVGGITQRIGVTYLDKSHLQKYVKEVKKNLKLPGYLFVDTPGHDCFSSSRMIATDVADLSIIVMDIFKGVEEHTKEVLSFLIEKKKPFIVFLNKTDRLEGWVNKESLSSLYQIKKQTKLVQKELKKYVNQVIAQLAVLEKNAALLGENPDEKEYITIIAGSAKTKMGFPEITAMIDHFGSDFMDKKLKSKEITRGLILETHKDEKHGHGATVVLTDGMVKRSDMALVKTYSGIKDVQIKDIFVPPEGKEMKDKLIFTSVDEQKSGRGVFLRFDDSRGIEPAYRFYVYSTNEERSNCLEKLENEVNKSKKGVSEVVLQKPGIVINASSYLSADAVRLEFQKRNVPISHISIGPLTKKDIMMASLHHKIEGKMERLNYTRYMVLVVYGHKVSDEMKEMAKKNNIVLLNFDIIYRFGERYDLLLKRIKDSFNKVYPNIVTPVKASIFPQYIFTTRSPYVFGVKILFGTLKAKQLISVTNKKSRLFLGKLVSIQKDNSELEEATRNQEVCLKIEPLDGGKKYTYDEDFDYTWTVETVNTTKEKIILDRYAEFFEIKKEKNKIKEKKTKKIDEYV